MEITNDMLAHAEKANWDEDITQEVWVKVLEYTGKAPERVEAWLTTIYSNARNAYYTKEQRRRELELMNVQAMENVHGLDDVHDPLDYISAEELISRFGELSPLLYNTLRDYVEGSSVEEIAAKQGVDPNTIYQRIHQAKKELQDGR